MPRSRSMSMESSTCSTISRSARPPVAWISRSASVDLPWSICAMITKLRMLSMAAFMARGLPLASASGKDWRFLGYCCGRGSLRRNPVFRQERLDRDPFLVARHDRMAGRHRLPMRALGIERLRHDNDIAARLAVIERVGVVVGGVAEGVEIASVGERAGDARRLFVAVGAAHLGERPKHARGGPEGILVAAGAEDGEKDRFRMGRADARAIELVGNERFDSSPQPSPVADHAVVHE